MDGKEYLEFYVDLLRSIIIMHGEVLPAPASSLQRSYRLGSHLPPCAFASAQSPCVGHFVRSLLCLEAP